MSRIALAPLTVAYVTDLFPVVTLTFVYLEIEKLREFGLCIHSYAIWKSPQHNNFEDAKSISEETNYLSPPRVWPLVQSHCYYAWRVPKRYLDNFKLCFAHHPTTRLRCRTLYNFLLAPYFARILEIRRTSHIHAHFASGAATTAMMASNLLNISFSFTAHGSDVLIEKCLLIEKLKRAKFAIAISDYNKHGLMREAPDVERNKVKVIHCGVDPDVFYPVCGINGGPPVLLAVGSLVKEKGHAYLIEACRVVAMNRIDFRCIIVGEGLNRPDLEKLIMRHKLGGKVELVGAIPHERIQAYFDRADIFVHPSTSEGIPVALMEAMSKRLPVIASRITGIPELVKDSVNGILIPAGDVVALAEGIMRLLSDTDLRMRLGANARETISRNFNREVNTKKIKELLEAEFMKVTAEGQH
jgi:colanic acid/amylovoran biosynthesis glycosyltransferase